MLTCKASSRFVTAIFHLWERCGNCVNVHLEGVSFQSHSIEADFLPFTGPPSLLLPHSLHSLGNCWEELLGNPLECSPAMVLLAVQLFTTQKHPIISNTDVFQKLQSPWSSLHSTHSYHLPPSWAFYIAQWINFVHYANNSFNILNLWCFSRHLCQSLAVERMKSQSNYSFYKSSSKHSNV